MCGSHASPLLAIVGLLDSHGSCAATTSSTRLWRRRRRSHHRNGYRRQCTASSSSSSHTIVGHIPASATGSLMSHSRSHSSDLCRFYRSVEGLCSSHVFTVSCVYPLSIVDGLSGTIVAYDDEFVEFLDHHESRRIQ